MTAPAKFSNEGLIASTLRDLGCSQRSFTQICKALHIQVSDGRLSEGLTGKTRFDHSSSQKLLEVAKELKAVRDRFPDCPLDWSQSERVATLIALGRVQRVLAESD
jgi:hypothetical protein